jgi:diaminohydroxyphosphoribosylaminopyrimidine deaminase/5-amino-6-(5-phosphoribosylamino)uracil reductase
MRRALALARRGEGLTRPNPPVGAVVVRRGKQVGEGYHRKAGGPHAEVYALRQAGRQARGADLYVTLEPCATWGRTPPCTDAILKAGIRRVFYAVPDPNPVNYRRGLARLRRRGVQVREGIGREEGERLAAPFAHHIRTGRPLVTLKLAVTLDGRIADRQGRSRWISGPASRALVQALRRRTDAVLVGRGTVDADNPSLQPRPARGRRPYRVIVDSRGRLNLHARVLTDRVAEQTLVATTRHCSTAARRRLERKGARRLVLPAGRGGVSLTALLTALGKLGVMHVLCEGGGRLAGQLIRSGLVDEMVLFIAPIALGEGGRAAVAGVNWSMQNRPEWNILDVRKVGRDIVLRLAAARRPGGAR